MKSNQIFNYALGIALLAATACTKNQVPVPPTPPTTTILLASTAKFGNVMTDSAGMTLYFFANDATGASACTGGCLAAWPVFYKANLNLPSGLNASDFGTITRADGSKQSTYKKWPLYYYASDLKAGDINGDLVGGTWFVAKPDYTILWAKTQLVGKNGLNYDSTLVAGTGTTVYMTDAWGRTLYAFSPDHFNKNTYTKSDFSNDPTWPIYQGVTGGSALTSNVASTDFGIATVFTKTQLTFKGWPLYYYVSDSATRGWTRGVSIASWPIIKRSTPVAPL
jgi:predicted lipoprotein with Yx(FWY)xxD motif